MTDFALIIEDDEDLAEIFGQALIAASFSTEIIHDGAVAQRRLKEVVPTVIVLDIHMPSVEGDVLLEQVRADERLAKAKVIVATADAQMGEVVREAADFVLIKPVTFGQLRDLTMRLRQSE